jgi:hypothetical protein
MTCPADNYRISNIDVAHGNLADEQLPRNRKNRVRTG